MAQLFILILVLILETGVCPLPVVRRETAEAVGALSDGGEAVVSQGKMGKHPVANEPEKEYDDFETITDEDREQAEQALVKELLTYAAYTLLVVVGSVFTVVCFLMDPRACLVAFASGSPCCLLFPCYKDLMQYTEPAKLIRANVNIYVPGIYIEEGGTLREYPPTPEEMDCLQDLVSEFMTAE